LTRDLFVVSEDGKGVGAVDFGSVQNPTQPLAVALVVDNGAKMWTKTAPTPLEKTVEAGQSFLEQLNPQDEVAVVKFSDQAATIFGLSADKSGAKQALGSLQAEGNKSVQFDAMVEGVKALKGFTGRRVIVLMTNGQDTHSGVYDLKGAVREANNAGIAVYEMGFGGGISVGQMEQTAEQTGGYAYLKQTEYDLRSAFDSLLRVLHEEYRVGYVSRLTANNSEHELRVSVTYKGEEEVGTEQFVSMNNPIPVSLPNYQEGQVVGGMVKFAPLVEWPAGLSSLEISLDGGVLKTVTSAPFEYEWNSMQAKTPSGVHEFIFKGTDMAGNIGQAKIHLDVEPAITVKIKDLKEGSVVGGPITVVAEVTGQRGITIQRVDFVVDGKVLTTITAAPYETRWDPANYSAGPHSVSMVAYDSQGLFPTTEAINVQVEVGSTSVLVVPIVVLLIAALVIPVALRARRRTGRGKTAVPVSSGQPVLEEMEGMNPGQVWPLGSSQVRLGRKRDENDIPLKGLNASRRHAYITVEQGQYVIYPLSPNNPVLVNNVQVVQKQVLQAGDVIRLGETTLRFNQ
jgi:hypothetical protein